MDTGTRRPHGNLAPAGDEYDPAPVHGPFREAVGILSRGDRLGARAAVTALGDRLATGTLARQAGRARSSPPVPLTPPFATQPPSVSVVIPTCADAVVLERTIASVLSTRYEPMEVLVVENRPPAASTRRVVEEVFGRGPVRYIEEPRRGASWARNAGLARASGEVIAFTDDDVVVDIDWIEVAIAAFRETPNAACVTGRILPLARGTRPQVLFHQLTTFDKGSERQVFRLPESRGVHPLFPYVAGHIGSGANIFIRRDVALQMGGFDPNLGPGTPALGGEDLDLFIRLVHAGHTIVYSPGVTLMHDDPDDLAELRRHAYRYGVGVTAMLAKQLLRGPAPVKFLRSVPAGIRYVRNPNSRKNVMKCRDYPPALERLERAGMLLGPAAYLLSITAAAAVERARAVRASGHGT